MANGIFLLGAIILVGLAGSLLFNKTKIPESIFLIIIGLLIGPGFHLVSPELLLNNASFLISLALVVVLLESGLTLNISKALSNMSRAAFYTVSLLVLNVIIVALTTHYFFGWEWIHGIFLGIIVSGTTTITISHLVERLSIGNNTKTLLILESIISDITVLTGVSILISYTLSGSKASLPGIIFNELIMSTLVGLAFALIWAIVLLKFVHGSRLGYVFTLGLAFTIFDGVGNFGLNGTITIIVFSLALGNYGSIVNKLKSYRKLKPIKTDIGVVKGVNLEITFIMRTLFFVFLGIVFDVDSLVGSVFIFAIVIVIAKVLSRFLAASAFSWANSNFKNSIGIMTTLIPSGYAATLAAFLPAGSGLKIPYLVEITLLLVMFTHLWSIIGSAIIERRLIGSKQHIY